MDWILDGIFQNSRLGFSGHCFEFVLLPFLFFSRPSLNRNSICEGEGTVFRISSSEKKCPGQRIFVCSEYSTCSCFLIVSFLTSPNVAHPERPLVLLPPHPPLLLLLLEEHLRVSLLLHLALHSDAGGVVAGVGPGLKRNIFNIIMRETYIGNDDTLTLFSPCRIVDERVLQQRQEDEGDAQV